jgi:hypothetical protein
MEDENNHFFFISEFQPYGNGKGEIRTELNHM